MAIIPGAAGNAQDGFKIMSTFRLVTTVAAWIEAEGRPPKPEWLKAEHSAEWWRKIYWATPPWLTQEMADQMKAIYDSAAPSQHVDHIVPLKNDLVCGLHVPWNLQLMDAKKNMQKGNTWWKDHPFETPQLVPPIHESQRQINLI